MVAFTKGDKGSDDVVTRRVPVVKRLISEPVGEGVDAESSLLNEADSKDAGIDEATQPVTPAETTDKGWQSKSHEKYAFEVVAVLPDNDGVLVEIGDVGATSMLGALLENHPAEVRVEKTLADGVGVLFGVGVAVVRTMLPGPPSNGTLDSTSSNSGEINLEGKRGLVRCVSPETMVTWI
jgi:hypothetical protein